MDHIRHAASVQLPRESECDQLSSEMVYADVKWGLHLLHNLLLLLRSSRLEPTALCWNEILFFHLSFFFFNMPHVIFCRKC